MIFKRNQGDRNFYTGDKPLEETRGQVPVSKKSKDRYFDTLRLSTVKKDWRFGEARIFPVNSVRFFFGIMYNGIQSAINGE